LEGYQRWGIYLLLEIVAALAAISYLVSKFPEFIPNTAISAIAQSYLIVAVTLILASTQIQRRDLKVWANAVNIFSIILTLFTLINSNIDTSFKVLSTNVVTSYFSMSTLILLTAIEFTAMGLLVPKVQDLSNNGSLSDDYWKRYIN
jgi:hypothetical protein